MPDLGKNRREHVRLPSEGSSVEGLSGAIENLPGSAEVVDISEGGVKLAFPWDGQSPFPLQDGDSISFQLRVAGINKNLELMSIVRHVAPDPDAGKVFAGVQFDGLDQTIREVLKSSLMNLAMTRLRARTPGSGAIPVPPGQSMPTRRSLTSVRARFDQDPAAVKPPPGAVITPSAPKPIPSTPDGKTFPVHESSSVKGSPDDYQRSERTIRRRRMYLGEILVKQGAIDADNLQEFIKKSVGDKVPIGQKLIAHGLVDDITIAKALAEQSGLPYIDLMVESPDIKYAMTLPRDTFAENHCVPVRLDGPTLHVAMSAKPSPPVIEVLELATNKRIRVHLAAESHMARWLKRIYNYEAPSRYAQARFPVQLRVEYRFLDKDRRHAVHDLVAAGITRELGPHEMIIAGPLPIGVTPDRIRDEHLTLEVQAEGSKLANQIVLECRVLSVSPSGYAGEFHIACYIDAFPPGGENAWTRLCMTLS